MDEAFSNLVREIRKYNKVRSFFFLLSSLGLVSARIVLDVDVAVSNV